MCLKSSLCGASCRLCCLCYWLSCILCPCSCTYSAMGMQLPYSYSKLQLSVLVTCGWLFLIMHVLWFVMIDLTLLVQLKVLCVYKVEKISCNICPNVLADRGLNHMMLRFLSLWVFVLHVTCTPAYGRNRCVLMRFDILVLYHGMIEINEINNS